jgi:hypothetical protein
VTTFFTVYIFHWLIRVSLWSQWLMSEWCHLHS